MDERPGESALGEHANSLLSVVLGVIVFLLLVIAGFWLALHGWLWLQSLD